MKCSTLIVASILLAPAASHAKPLFGGDMFMSQEQIFQSFGATVAQEAPQFFDLRPPDSYDLASIALREEHEAEQNKTSARRILGTPMGHANIWKHGRVYYHFDGSTLNANEINTLKTNLAPVITLLKNTANITLIEKEVPHFSLSIGNRGGCSSSVGAVYNPQMNLKPTGCTSIRTISHEFLHTLGQLHEQSNFERDDYIKIHFENIYPYALHNFNKVTTQHNLGVKYDFKSVMHYRRGAWSMPSAANNVFKDTIEILDKDVSDALRTSGHDLGNNLMSPRDAVQLQLMYHCALQEPFSDAGDVITVTSRAMRSINDLCDSNCPCYEGQGNCKVDTDCHGALVCVHNTNVYKHLGQTLTLDDLELTSLNTCVKVATPPPTIKPPTTKPPTAKPTTKPPTAKPKTKQPTTETKIPSKKPTTKPTTKPPTAKPKTKQPTTETKIPSKKPTTKPTTKPPTVKPKTKQPTTETKIPSKNPTTKPTTSPTTTTTPTTATTNAPTTPTSSPTRQPSGTPTSGTLIAIAVDPECNSGVITGDACCAKECGKVCWTVESCSMEGAQSQCCPSTNSDLFTARSCNDFEAPCSIDISAIRPESEIKEEKVPSITIGVGMGFLGLSSAFALGVIYKKRKKTDRVEDRSIGYGPDGSIKKGKHDVGYPAPRLPMAIDISQPSFNGQDSRWGHSEFRSNGTGAGGRGGRGVQSPFDGQDSRWGLSQFGTGGGDRMGGGNDRGRNDRGGNDGADGGWRRLTRGGWGSAGGAGVDRTKIDRRVGGNGGGGGGGGWRFSMAGGGWKQQQTRPVFNNVL